MAISSRNFRYQSQCTDKMATGLRREQPSVRLEAFVSFGSGLLGPVEL